jgi:hypothetical protein
MKRYCKTCKRLTESSKIKKTKIKKLSFHICLSCGNPYEYKSFDKIAHVLVTNPSKSKAKQTGITKHGKAGTSVNTYELYLCTQHWKDIRRKKLDQKPVCEICKDKKATQVHHLRYNDDNGKTILYKEKLSDLCSVCKTCHKKLHSI